MKNRISNYWKSALLLLSVLMFSSCLTGNLDDLPAFDEAEITDVKFDFRYKDASDEWIDGEPTVKVVGLTVQNKVVDPKAGTITCTLAVPAADGPFTETIRNGVVLTSIVGKFNLSTAASIAPMEGAPKLGVPGDFSAVRKYKVTAANGDTKVWTVHITGLTK